MALPLLLFPSVIITTISGLLIPEFSTFYAKGDNKQIKRISNRILKITFIFAILVFGVFFTFPDALSNIIYNDTNVVHFIKLLAPLIILMYIDTIVDGILKGLNEQVAVMKCNILDLFLSTFLLYILLPIMGINGYIVVLYVSEILNTTISVIQLIKVSKIKINYLLWGIIVINISVFIFVYLSYLAFASIISKNDFKI